MATEYYRVQHNEEQEPLTESDGIDKTPWKWESETQLQQIRNTTPRWIWITHAVLFSISLSIFALSFSQKLSTCPESLPFTYCTEPYPSIICLWTYEKQRQLKVQ